jgi:hypothetical protein
MTYQQGYPPQQQPAGMYQGGYPAGPGRGASPATAIIAAVLGLVAAASLIVINVDFFSKFMDNASFGDLPGGLKTLIILRFAGAAVLLTGLIIILFRKLAGAFVLILGALLALAAILLYPVLLKDFFPSLDFAEYVKTLFKFNSAQTTFAAITVIAAPLALIMAILPPTLRYLRGPAGDFPQYPQQTYPQPGYPQQPNW